MSLVPFYLLMEVMVLLECNRYLLYPYFVFVQVMMKDLVTPIPPDEIYGVVKKCLENAALMNYTKVTEMAKAEGIHNNPLFQ